MRLAVIFALYAFTRKKNIFLQAQSYPSKLMDWHIVAIRYGDPEFFMEYSQLDNASILIYFDSANQDYNKFEDWGTLEMSRTV